MGQSIPRIPEKLGFFCLNSWGEAGLGSPRLDFISIISWWGWSWDFPWMEFPRFARDYLEMNFHGSFIKYFWVFFGDCWEKNLLEKLSVSVGALGKTNRILNQSSSRIIKHCV